MSHGTKGVSSDGCGHGSLSINDATLQPLSQQGEVVWLTLCTLMERATEQAWFPLFLMGEVHTNNTPCVISGRSV